VTERPWLPRHRRARRVMATGDGAATVLDQAPPFPESAGRWLARLCLLEGLPFEHLVPDARMLPAESMRTIAQKSCSVLQEMGPSIQWVEKFFLRDGVIKGILNVRLAWKSQ